MTNVADFSTPYLIPRWRSSDWNFTKKYRKITCAVLSRSVVGCFDGVLLVTDERTDRQTKKDKWAITHLEAYCTEAVTTCVGGVIVNRLQLFCRIQRTAFCPFRSVYCVCTARWRHLEYISTANKKTNKNRCLLSQHSFVLLAPPQLASFASPRREIVSLLPRNAMQLAPTIAMAR